MAIQAHLVELERKHKILESELHEALLHLSTDDLEIVELKRRKLMVKDQIERLRHAAEETADRTAPGLQRRNRSHRIFPEHRMMLEINTILRGKAYLRDWDQLALDLAGTGGKPELGHILQTGRLAPA